MSESMYKVENISYIEHVKKQSKNCIDWRQLETPRWLEELNHQPHQSLIPQWCSPDSMDDFMSGWIIAEN